MAISRNATKRTKRYSIAEAKDRLAKIVHEAEGGISIELTRRNEPVAAMISMQQYQQLQQQGGQFWHKLQHFLEKLGPDEHIDADDVKGWRDSTPGRNVEF
jgi:prevent-host-death family protein